MKTPTHFLDWIDGQLDKVRGELGRVVAGIARLIVLALLIFAIYYIGGMGS